MLEKSPPVEKTKARISFATATIKKNRAKNNLAALRRILASLWGNTTPTFKIAEGEFYYIPSIQPFKQLENLVLNNPDTLRWKTELEKNHAAIALVEAGKVFDLTLSGGIRNYTGTTGTALILGLSMPIPIFNRNQGSA